MKASLPALALVLALVAAAAAADIARVEKLLDDPPATGLLVSAVFDGTPAQAAGVMPGDVLLTYDGKGVADLEALNKAKEGAAGKEAVEVKALRGDQVVSFSLAPGQIGVSLVPVTKGVAAAPLPKATEFVWDFSSLAKAPRDDWYEFHLPGRGKVGFEHAMLSLADGHLVLRREVAFDGGEQWGLNHFDVTVKMALAPTLHAVSTRFVNPITKWVGEGVLNAGTNTWVFAWGGEGHERGNRSMPVTGEYVPDYIVESLAAFLPREVGTSFHFRSLSTGWPGPALTSALHAAAEEELTIGGEKVKTVRFDVTSRGGPVSSKHWVDAAGRVVSSDYSGASAIRATKEKALAGLHEGIVPQTAGPRGKATPPEQPEKDRPPK